MIWNRQKLVDHKGRFAQPLEVGLHDGFSNINNKIVILFYLQHLQYNFRSHLQFWLLVVINSVTNSSMTPRDPTSISRNETSSTAAFKTATLTRVPVSDLLLDLVPSLPPLVSVVLLLKLTKRFFSLASLWYDIGNRILLHVINHFPR